VPERNPYLLLGLDYGVGADEARRAFARAARRLRRSGGTEVTIEDLNWALHQIQSQDGDPFDAVGLFRVPANPAVFNPTGEGLFTPPPVPLARGGTTEQSDVDIVVVAAADEAAALLGATTPHVVSFDLGYDVTEGRPDDQKA
jgi:hypothetical protein